MLGASPTDMASSPRDTREGGVPLGCKVLLLWLGAVSQAPLLPIRRYCHPTCVPRCLPVQCGRPGCGGGGERGDYRKKPALPRKMKMSSVGLFCHQSHKHDKMAGGGRPAPGCLLSVRDGVGQQLRPRHVRARLPHLPIGCLHRHKLYYVCVLYVRRRELVE